MPDPSRMRKREIAHYIAMRRAADPHTLLTYDQHLDAVMKLSKPQLRAVAREMEAHPPNPAEPNCEGT